jgi:hypothetical protein
MTDDHRAAKHPLDYEMLSFVDPSSGGLPATDRVRIARHCTRCRSCFFLVCAMREQLGLTMLPLLELSRDARTD